MAMKHCKECGSPVSTNAKCCPKCGSKKWRGSSLWKITGVGIVVIVVLAAIGGNNDGPNTPRSARAGNTLQAQSHPLDRNAATLPDSPEPQVYGKWQVRSSTSNMDDSTTVTLWLDADTRIQRWPRKQHRPRLAIRYHEGRLDCFIDVGGPPNVEYGMVSSATTTLRFDDGEPETFTMHESTNSNSLFFSGPDSIVRRLAQTNRLVFRHTPFNSNPATTTFNLQGLADAIKLLEAQTDWRLNQ